MGGGKMIRLLQLGGILAGAMLFFYIMFMGAVLFLTALP